MNDISDHRRDRPGPPARRTRSRARWPAVIVIVALLLLLAFITLGPNYGAGAQPTGDPVGLAPLRTAGTLTAGAATSSSSIGPAPAPTTSITPSALPGSSSTAPVNVYAAAASGLLDPSVAGFPPRVYVPNEGSNTVVVIDPTTFKIVGRFAVGRQPEHIAPAWDLGLLYVDNMGSNSLTIIDPRTARPIGTRSFSAPYNLYFTLDGTKAIDVLDYKRSYGNIAAVNRLDFYDRTTWKLLGSVGIPYAGADHLDMTADGRYLLLSTEYAGVVVKVDTVTMKIVGTLKVGGLPVDVRLSPDGKIFYVTNQGRGGVSLIDPVTMREVAFLRTGYGAHGLAVSRDATRLYVSNRLAGTISVIDFASRKIVATWKVGRSPDMLSVSPDGSQLWTSNRFHGSVSVIDTRTGKVLAVIATGTGPHGLVYYPQPGRISLGHNGVFR